MHSPAGDIGLVRALELYQKAISLDDEFADAYAGYARAAAYLVDVQLRCRSSPAPWRARGFTRPRDERSRLNPELPRAHAVLAEAQSVDGEHEAAIKSARRAVEFGPSDAEAYATLASVLAYAGHAGRSRRGGRDGPST